MNPSTTVEQLADSVLATADQAGLDAAVARLDDLDAAIAVEVCDWLQRECYWKRKDLPAVVAFSRAGIRRAVDDPELKGRAKTIAANLASFSWPGWDEKGIVITAEDLTVGLEAARLNARLAEELGRPEKAKANALWTLGAHWLAAKDYAAAVETFMAAKAYAEPLVGRMLDGYLSLVDVLLQSDAAANARLDRIVAELKADGSEDATEYARQLPVALAVFSADNAAEVGVGKS